METFGNWSVAGTVVVALIVVGSWQSPAAREKVTTPER